MKTDSQLRYLIGRTRSVLGMVRVQSGPPPPDPPNAASSAASAPPPPPAPSRPAYDSQLSASSAEDFVVLDRPSPTNTAGTPQNPNPSPFPSLVSLDRFLVGEAYLDLGAEELQIRLRNLLFENKVLREEIHQSSCALTHQVQVMEDFCFLSISDCKTFQILSIWQDHAARKKSQHQAQLAELQAVLDQVCAYA